MYALKVDLSVAIVCMVNRTGLEVSTDSNLTLDDSCGGTKAGNESDIQVNAIL